MIHVSDRSYRSLAQVYRLELSHGLVEEASEWLNVLAAILLGPKIATKIEQTLIWRAHFRRALDHSEGSRRNLSNAFNEPTERNWIAKSARSLAFDRSKVLAPVQRAQVRASLSGY